MRVLIVNTSEKTGGAAVAANRLMDALNNNGVKAKMLVRDKETEDITVVSLPPFAQVAVELPVGALVRILASPFLPSAPLGGRHGNIGYRYHQAPRVSGGRCHPSLLD